MGLQIAGGNGFMKEYPYEKVVRDSRINLIFEGTNEILRLYIGLSCLKEVGNHLKEVQSSLGSIFSDPSKGFEALGSYSGDKLRQLTSLGKDGLDFAPDCLKKEANFFENSCLKLAQASEAAVKKHRKGIIDEQFIVRRLADVAIDTVVGLAVLSRVSDRIATESEEAASREIDILRVFTQGAKERIKNNLRCLEKNADKATESLADSMISSERYPYDLF